MSAGQIIKAPAPGQCGVCSKKYKAGSVVQWWDEVLCHADCVSETDQQTTVLVMRGVEGSPVAVPEDIVVASERPYRAYLLKQGGHSWESIALAEHYPDWKAARADVKRYLEEGSSLISDFSRKQLMELMLGRLDALNMAIWVQAMKGNLPAVNSSLAITAQTIKLLRLDQDVRDDDDDSMAGRTVVVPSDDDGYSEALQVASKNGKAS